MSQTLGARALDHLISESTMIRRVVVALDGTQFAERALPVATGLAYAYHADVLLVHIGAGLARSDRPARHLWPIPRHPREDVHAMSLYLARTETTMREQGVRAHSRLVRAGTDDVSDALLRVCEQMGADMLVLATHAGPGSKTFARSGFPLASAITRDAALPVMLVSGATTNPFAWSDGQGMTVLVPMRPDATAEEHGGLAWATALARQYHGQVALLLSAEDDAARRTEHGSGTWLRDHPTVRRGATKLMEQVRAGWSASDVPLWATLTSGDLITEAGRQARGRADLIVLPLQHGEDGTERMQEAFELLRTSKVPVLLVPDTTPAACLRGSASTAQCAREAIHGVGPSR